MHDILVIGAGIAGAIRGAVKGAHDRKHRNRPVNVVLSAPGGVEHSVLKSGGDILSEVFTKWFIKNKNITPETVRSLQLSFGDILKLNNGVFSKFHKRKPVDLAFDDITNLEIRQDSVMFFGLNEKGKDKCLIDINAAQMYNIDLLFEVVEMASKA